MFFKTTIIIFSLALMGLVLPCLALAGPIGTSAACVGADTNRGANYCYDYSNANEFESGSYDPDKGLLSIRADHNFGAKKVELHFCYIDLYQHIVSADGNAGKILINTTDGAYSNGGQLCENVSNYLHMAGTVQSSGSNGAIEIKTYDFNMNLVAVAATGTVSVSGPAGTAAGTIKITTYSTTTIDGTVSANGGAGTSGGKGGTIEINSPSAITLNQAISSNGGDMTINAYNSGGGGGTIKINSSSTIIINQAVSSNGGFGFSGGKGGTIEINSPSAITINQAVSSSGSTGSYGGGGGTIKINSSSTIIINQAVSSNGGFGYWNYGGGGGTIEINSPSAITINQAVSSIGGNGSTGNGGTINISTLNTVTLSNSILSYSSVANAGTTTISAFSLNMPTSTSTINGGGFLNINVLGPSTIKGSLTAVKVKLSGSADFGSSFNISNTISAPDKIEIFSAATSSFSGAISAGNLVDINGFSFNFSGAISATAQYGKVNINSTSSLNISNNITTGNYGTINLNSTSTSIALTGSTNAPYGTTTITAGTDFTSANNNSISANYIFITTGSSISLGGASTTTLNAANGLVKIGLQTCGTISIAKTNLYAYVGATGGAISIFAKDLQGISGNFTSKNVIYVIYTNSCSGLNADTCLPKNITASPNPTITHEVTEECILSTGVNITPYKPGLFQPTPTGVQGVGLCPELIWTAGDPEGQNLTFKIYFSTSSAEVDNMTIAPIASFTTSSLPNGAITTYTYILPNPLICSLLNETWYYWKVKVTDNP